MENSKNWLDRCEQVVFFLLLVLMADCTFFGAGRTLIIGGLGFRMMILGLLMVCSLPVILRDFKKLLTNKVLWILVAFAAWLAFQAVRGIRNGNSFAILVSDLKGFAYFVAVLPAICVLNSEKRLHTLMKTMMYTSVALAVVSVICTCMYRWCHDVFTAIHDLDLDSNILVLSCIIERKVPRLFFKSTNYFLVGCAFSLYFYATGEKKGNLKYPMLTGLCLFALLMSYTRACYLAAAVAAFALLVIFLVFGTKEIRAKTWKWLGLAAMVFAVITGGLSLIMGTNYIKHGLARVSATFSMAYEQFAEEKVMLMVAPGGSHVVSLSATQWQTEEFSNAEIMTTMSDEVRAMTLAEMSGYISESFVLGHGLGKAITCRDDGLVEYFYHDLIVKTGVIGLVLYLLPILLMGLALLGKIGGEQKLLLGSWMAVLLGFLAFSYYNPYMNASLGILFYCTLIGIFSNMRKQKS